MRLTCPNCDAQYEVDDAVIPEAGRDVQCSNCGHTWFQASSSMLRAETARTEVAAADTSVEDTFEEDEPADALPAAAVQSPAQDVPAPRAPATPPEPDMKRRPLDEAVLNVLREEAERETRARVAEGSALETQGDLGLNVPASPSPPPAQDPSRAVMPDPVGAETSEEDHTEALVSRAARRELLPDIEEINSTLRATSERRNEPAAIDAPETLRQRRNGFRRGFFSALAVMAILFLPYAFAKRLAAGFPAAAPALAHYEQGIDSIRVWMDAQMRSSTQSMRDSSTKTN